MSLEGGDFDDLPDDFSEDYLTGGAGGPAASAWLPVDDRLWRHPSEVARSMQSRRHRKGPRLWLVALVGGLSGALITASVLTAVNRAGLGGPQVQPVSETTPASPGAAGSATSASHGGREGPEQLPAGQSLLAAARRLGPSTVAVKVATARGERTGSGTVVRADGMVLTTASLLSGATGVSIVDSSHRRIVASVVGTDPSDDIAVLYVPRAGLPAPELATSSLVRRGEVALALSAAGSGTWPRVAVGTVTGTGIRAHLTTSSWVSGSIQTDTPLPPSATGGMVLDRSGRVLGIMAKTTGKGALTQWYTIPMALALVSAGTVLSRAGFAHGWLGILGRSSRASTGSTAATGSTSSTTAIGGTSTTALTGASTGGPGAGKSGGGVTGGGVTGGGVTQAVRVTALSSSGPASLAGVRVSDLITRMDGHRVRSMSALKALLALQLPGQVVVLSVQRAHQTLQLRVRLAGQPPDA